MKNSDSIGVKDLIQLAGLLCMGATSFLGLNYWLSDSILAISLSIGVVICAATYGLVYILVKAKKSEVDKDRAKVAEFIALAGYVIVAVVAGIFTLHYLTVEIDKKDGIKTAATESFEEIGDISKAFQNQETRWIDNFEKHLKNAVRENKNIYGMTSASNDENIQAAIKDNLTSKIDKTGIENKAMTFKNKGLSAVSEWSYFSIMNTLTHIDENKQSYINDLQALSKQIPKELEDMQFNPPVTKTMQSKLSELEEIDFENGVYGLWAVVFLITNFMTLFPYLFGDRGGMKLGKEKLSGGFSFDDK
ncbi:MAG: hypothetical protein LBH60_09105 [Prevotellaceae bacterium]|jgi:hypothetical protein|nr:hypothetical protein [Prevotellaceae bacterium]